MCGTSCSGTNAVRYGTMRQNVLNLTVVLADGTILKTAQRARKSSAGYNLTHAFIVHQQSTHAHSRRPSTHGTHSSISWLLLLWTISQGTEGTLGIVTEATLRLQNIPEHTAVAVCSFPSIHQAAGAAIAVMRKGIRIGCVELLDEVCVRIVNQHIGTTLEEKPTIFFKSVDTTLPSTHTQTMDSSINQCAAPLTIITANVPRL